MRVAAATVTLCIAILLGDYFVATWRSAPDDKIVKTLQQQVKSDAALASRLAAEQKRITSARRARKSRDNAVAWILIAAAGVFLTLAKRQVGRALPRPARPPRVSEVRIEPRASVSGSAPSLDLTFIDDLVAKQGPSKENAIIFLQAIQQHYRYLPDEALRRLTDLTGITPAQFAGTSSFYGQFRSAPAGKHTVRVCHGTACHVAGARQITDELRRYLAIPEGADTDLARMFTLDEVACLGCCSLAPVLIVDGHTAGRLTPASAATALAHVEETQSA